MASLVAATPISTRARTPICIQAVDHSTSTGRSTTALPFRKRGADLHGAACEKSRSVKLLDRREMMAKMTMASGAAALLSLGAGVGAADAAKGEIETAEEAASNPLIQSMGHSLSVALNACLCWNVKKIL
jgi:hypothetical protein